MKKEELIKYIDNIQPDIYMKTRLKAKIIRSKPSAIRPKKIISCITALCLVVSLVVGAGIYGRIMDDDEIENSDTTSNRLLPDIMGAFIVVASAADRNKGETAVTPPLEVDKAYPYGVYFKVSDVRTMSEKQKENLLQEMNEELNVYAGKDNFVFGRSSIVATDTVYMVICSVNEFRFDIQQDKTIKSINVKNASPFGQMVYSSGKPDFSAPLCGADITVSGEDFDPTTSGFYWDYTDELVGALEENPDIPFSAFNDVITFTVEFADGSESVGTVELNFDTYGNAAAVCKKYESRKAGG